MADLHRSLSPRTTSPTAGHFAGKTGLVILAGLLAVAGRADVPIELDFRQPTKPLTTFWNSTGFSPADVVATGEMQQVLRDVGQLPEKGIKYVRPHYLLNLAVVRGMASGRPVYDWTGLDQALDELVRNHLRLIFELMGFPSDGTGNAATQYDQNFQEQVTRRQTYFDNLRDRRQLQHWKDFISALALHLEERYGREQVRSWLFESTNEPDLPQFWRYDVATFLNYYDACSEGLKAVDPALQFGGPGTAHDFAAADAREPSAIFAALLAHCDQGRNYFTGETGVRIDFISVHAKALPVPMIKRELRVFDYLRTHHAKLAGKPFINDEADPIAGWAKPYWWERGPWYAAFVAQNIDLHQRLVIEGAKVNYRLMSNDHTFLGDWNQRTTHALFRHQPNPAGFVAIKKPVLSVMEMIAQLGDRIVDVAVPPELADYFGVIPSLDHDTLAILVYNKTAIEIGREAKPEPNVELALMGRQEVHAQLHLRGIKGRRATLKEFRIDETHGNPHHEWVAMGRPLTLTVDQAAALKKAEPPALVRSGPIECPQNEYTLSLTVSSPSVHLIVVIPEPSGG